MNTIKFTPSIDDMTVSQLRAAGRATGQEPTETITLWDIDVAAAFGVTIAPELEEDGSLAYDEIKIELSDKPEHGWIAVTRDAGDKEWLVSHEQGWSTYDTETLLSTVEDLRNAAHLASWLNKGSAK
jgi:hypothetical protein